MTITTARKFSFRLLAARFYSTPFVLTLDEAKEKAKQMVVDSLSFLPFGKSKTNYPYVVASWLPTNLQTHSYLAPITPPKNQVQVPKILPNDVQGRTLFFRNTAIKLQKSGESRETLAYEAEMQEHMYSQMRHDWQLKSDMPKPLALGSIKRSQIDASVLGKIEQCAKRYGKVEFSLPSDEELLALAYNYPRGYNRYINDVTLSDAERQHASFACLHDAARLMRNGWYHIAPADFLHNVDGTSFRWNSQQLATSLNFGITARSEGAGTLQRWRCGVGSVNLRASGIADCKHIVSAAQLCTRHPEARLFFSHHPAEYQQTIAEVSCMGDFLLAWSLSMMDCWAARCELAQKDSNAAPPFDLRNELRAGYATFFATFTGLDRPVAEELLDAVINFDRLFAQIAYFCTSANAQEYAALGDIPPSRFAELYGADTWVQWNVENVKSGWDSKLGWSSDGIHQNLGPTSGPITQQELIKALYFITHMAFAEAYGGRGA